MLSRHRRSPKNLTLNEIYPDWGANDGVLSSMHSAPWYDYVNVRFLDYAYHGVQSGMKFAAPFLYNFITSDGTISEYGKEFVGETLLARYGLKWNHLWDLYQTEYNPLHSYDITETRTRDLTRSDDVDDSRTLNLSDVTTFPQKSTSSSQIRTPNLSETTSFPTKNITTSQTRTPNLEEETVVADEVTTNVEGTDDLTHGKQTETESENASTAQDNTFGFNTTSADGVPEGKSTQSGTSSSTETNSGIDARATTEDTTSTRDSTTTVTSTGTETIAGTEAESYTGNQSVSKTGTESTTNSVTESYTGTESVNHTGTDITQREASGEESEEIQSTKTGNIFKAPAELLSIDRDFWLTEYFSIVFDDIDAMLTLSIYSESEVYHKVF